MTNPAPSDAAIIDSDDGSNLGRVWAIALACLAFVPLLVPNIENRWLSAGVLFAFVPLQLVWHRLFGSRDSRPWRPVHDSLLILVVVSLSPAVWFPGVVVYAVVMGNIGRRQIPLVPRSLVFGIGLGIVAVGAVHDKPAWLATSITMIIVVSMRVALVDSLWMMVMKAQHSLEGVLESIAAVVYVADPGRDRVTWVTPNIERVTGWTPAQWMGFKPEDVVHPEDLAGLRIAKGELVLGREFDRYARHRHQDGSWIWLHVSSRVLLDDDGNTIVRGYYSDASELVAAHDEIQEIARRDEVTGLANRHVLLTELTARLQQPGANFGLLMLDVDRFKDINDTLGHNFGDDVLCELAQRIDAGAGDDLVCRLGGDEFAVLVSNPAGVEALAQRIGRTCAEPMQIGDLTVSTQVSIGSVITPDDGVTMQDLLRRGDIAMYQAKRRRRVHIGFEPEMEQTSSLELNLSASIADAIDAGQFEVFFQPKVNLLTEGVVGAEGLVRWRHPEHGLLPPDAFIHLVALSNSYRAFTDCVVDQACAFAASTDAQGTPIPVAVNIGMASMFDEGFPARVLDALERHGVSPHRLTLEVTEDDIMEEHAAVSPVIAEFAVYGVQLSIDDFGTGYSSLSRLVDLPVSEIKIDRRFVDHAVRQPRERAIVESTLDLARRLNLVAVAEGIETRDQADLLISCGCKVGQGFLFGEAVPPSELVNELRSRHHTQLALELGTGVGLR